jgi:cytoskeletal protein RodZ
MEENQGSPVASPRKKTGKIAGIILLAALLLVAFGAGVWYWQQQEVNRLSQNNAQLRETVEAKEQKLTRFQKQEQRDAQTSQSEEASSPGTEYTAEVGKFSLELPAEYAIVQHLDGQFEGRATRLSVGTYDEENGIPALYPTKKVEITARPLRDHDNFSSVKQYAEKHLENRNQQGSDRADDVTIDGVTALAYDTPGIGQARDLFFERNGIIYHMEVMEKDTPVLDAVINGFSFE